MSNTLPFLPIVTELFLNDHPVEVTSGTAVKLLPGDRVKIRGKYRKSEFPDYHPFRVVIEGELHRPQPLLTVSMDEGEDAYEAECLVEDRGGKPFLNALKEEGSTRILALTSEGEFSLWKSGILFQNGRHYFVGDWLGFHGQVYQKDGELECPILGNWNTMRAFMATILGEKGVRCLPLLPEKEEAPYDLELPTKEGYGTIVYFDPWKGHGEAVLHRGERALLHKSKINDTRVPLIFERGEMISFEKLEPREGKIPELHGVRRVRER